MDLVRRLERRFHLAQAIRGVAIAGLAPLARDEELARPLEILRLLRAAGLGVALLDLRLLDEAVAHLLEARRRVAERGREGETLLEQLARLLQEQVWGQGFPEPRFAGRFAVESQRVVGEKHLKLTLGLAGRRIPAIRFGTPDALPASIRAVYRLDVNEYQGTSSVQLVIEHVE